MEKKQYIAPSLTVVEFKTEKGYYLSGGNETLLSVESELLSTFNPQGQELWVSDGDLFGAW